MDGVTGDVRALPSRALPVMSCVLEVSRIGLATRALLDLIAGSLVAIFSFRRRLLSLLDRIYTEGRGLPRDLVFALSPGLRDELTVSAILISTAATNLRARPSPVVLASDASLDWEAGVECSVGPAFSRELSRHALIKPLWNRLLRPGAARERAQGCLPTDQELPSDEIKAHPQGRAVLPMWASLAATFPARPSHQHLRGACWPPGRAPPCPPSPKQSRQLGHGLSSCFGGIGQRALKQRGHQRRAPEEPPRPFGLRELPRPDVLRLGRESCGRWHPQRPS